MATAARLRGRSDILMFIGCLFLSAIAIVVPGGSTVAAVLRHTVIAPLLVLQEGSQRWRNAWLHRDDMMTVSDSVAMRVANAQALEAENEQLRALIGLGRRLGSGFVPAEALQTSEGEDYHFVTSLTLTAGSNAGIRKYSPVITPDGLVGEVQTADPTISVAILYTDPDWRASGMTADGSVFGMVSPHLEQGVTGRDRQYSLELWGVPYRDSLKTGTPIYTAGMGGVYPVGIPIGTVARELPQAGGLSRTYLLSPAVNPAKVSDVIILTPQRAAQGVGNVWASAVAMDSASRRIVAAGDSLARRALMLDAQSRVAAQDSIKRVTIDSVLRALGRRDTAGVRRDSTTRAAGSAAPPAGATRPDSVRKRVRPDTGTTTSGGRPGTPSLRELP